MHSQLRSSTKCIIWIRLLNNFKWIQLRCSYHLRPRARFWTRYNGWTSISPCVCSARVWPSQHAFDALADMSDRVNARSKYLVVAIMRYRLQHDGLHRWDVSELHLGYVQGTHYVGPACKTTNGEPQGSHTELLARSVLSASWFRHVNAAETKRLREQLGWAKMYMLLWWDQVLFAGSRTQCCDILWSYLVKYFSPCAH